MNRPKLKSFKSSSLLPCLILLSFPIFFFYSSFLHHFSHLSISSSSSSSSSHPHCNFTSGRWIHDPSHTPLYNHSCPFHRNAWNCLRNQRPNLPTITSWAWLPHRCPSPRIQPLRFLTSMRNRRIGFIGDSLNENFLVSFLCILGSADPDAKRWKRKGAWRGAHFPNFNVTVAYHRAVLLARYRWQPSDHSDIVDNGGIKGSYRVDVDIPADDWINVTKFYDVLIFNTGHWWGHDKFPKETPLVFYLKGNPIYPPLGISDGLQVVLNNMVTYIKREVPQRVLKFWRTQSPRHFYGGEWNQNGSCLFDTPLKEDQLDTWFDPKYNGVNKEAREANRMIERAIEGSGIQLLDLTHLSEFRADAHPAVWLGKKDAVAIWGQDCMHWCLPGVPDTWVDILSTLILESLERG